MDTKVSYPEIPANSDEVRDMLLAIQKDRSAHSSTVGVWIPDLTTRIWWINQYLADIGDSPYLKYLR